VFVGEKVLWGEVLFLNNTREMKGGRGEKEVFLLLLNATR